MSNLTFRLNYSLVTRMTMQKVNVYALLESLNFDHFSIQFNVKCEVSLSSDWWSDQSLRKVRGLVSNGRWHKKRGRKKVSSVCGSV